MNKQLVILAHGSRGDIQPYVALGRALKDTGCRVKVACPGRFESFVYQNGLDFALLAGDPADIARMLTDQVGSSYLRAIPAMLKYTLPLARRIMDDTLEACQDADAIIHSFLMSIAGHEVALALGIPDISALIFPVFSPTAAFPNPMFPALPLGGRYNRLTHQVFDRFYWWASILGFGWLRRKDKQLPTLHAWPFSSRAKPGKRKPVPVMYGLSPTVLKRPGDWPAHLQMTGYWFLDQPDYRPPAELQEFLDAGPPPVFLGFGSNVTRRAREVTGIAIAALERSGQRGLLLTGWGGLDQTALPREMVVAKRLMAIDSAPFDWLFPRMAALVHHGGMGTTSAGLRAGVPAALVPFTADQPFWARQLHEMGLSPAPIPGKKLDVSRLAEAISDLVTDGARRQRVEAIGREIQAEDGLSRAVALVKDLIQ